MFESLLNENMYFAWTWLYKASPGGTWTRYISSRQLCVDFMCIRKKKYKNTCSYCGGFPGGSMVKKKKIHLQCRNTDNGSERSSWAGKPMNRGRGRPCPWELWVGHNCSDWPRYHGYCITVGFSYLHLLYFISNQISPQTLYKSTNSFIVCLLLTSHQSFSLWCTDVLLPFKTVSV